MTTSRVRVGMLAACFAGMSATAHAGSTATVPIRLLGTEAPVIVVRVQGRELPLQLDLGDASSLVLHPEVLASLRTEPTADTFKGYGMDGKIETPIVRLQHVTIGDLELSGVAARLDVHDEAFRQYKKTDVGAVGFIGTGALRSGQIRVDYPGKTVTISVPDTKGAVRNVCGGRAVPFVVRDWGLMTAVSTELGELEFGLDTGAPAIVMSRSAAVASGFDKERDRATLEKFAIAGQDHGPQRIEIWDMPTPAGMAGLIGHPFFEAHVLCFDYGALTLHVE